MRDKTTCMAGPACQTCPPKSEADMAQFQVIEQRLVPKSTEGGTGEDRLVVTPFCAAVIDGATDKTGWRDQGRTGGQIVADCIATALETDIQDSDPAALVARLTAEVRNRLECCDDPPPGQPNAVFAALLPRHRCVLRVGDVGLMIDGLAHPAEKRVDSLLAEARALYLHLDPGPHSEGDPGRDAIMPWLTRQHRLQNDATSEWGFGCIDGTPVPAQFIEVIPLTRAHEVVLCSDGYPAPRPSLAEAEALLARGLAEDPDCRTVLRGTKRWDRDRARSHDDRCYLRLAVQDDGAEAIARSK